MAEQTDIYRVIVQVEGAQTVGELEQGLKDLKEELKKTDISSVAFADLQQAIGDAEDRLTGLGQHVRQSGDIITNSYRKAANGIVSGFQAAAGVMGVFSEGSEEAVKALTHIQSLMSLKEGFTGLLEAKKGFKELAVIIQTNLTRAFSTAAGAARAFGAALGIGLIIAALVTIIQKWDDIVEAVTGVNTELKKQNKLAQENVKVAEDNYKNLVNQEETLKRQGLSEKQILQYNIKQLEVLQEKRRVALQTAKDLLDAGLQANRELNPNGSRGGGSGFGVLKQFLFGTSPDDLQAQRDVITNLQNNLTEGQNKIDGFLNHIDDIDRKQAEDKAARAEKAKAQRIKDAEDEAKDAERRLEGQRKLAAEFFKNIQEDIHAAAEAEKLERDDQLLQIKDFYDQKQLALYDSLLQGQVTREEFDKQLSEIEDQRLQATIDLQQEYGDDSLDLLLKQKEKEIEIEKAAGEKKLENDKLIAEARIQVAQSVGDIFQNLGDILAGENDKQNALAKVAALIRIGIDTALAISALVRNSEANPANAVTGGLAGAAQFATGIARITKNIAEAKKLLGGSSTTNNVSTGSDSGRQEAPVIRPVPITTRQLTTGRGQDLKVKVLVKDINDGQRIVQVIEGNSLVVE